MSTQKGNSKKNRQQKYQNSHVFKNDRNDTTLTLKLLNSLQVTGVCKHCKEKIEWKIKYKKYKPLTVPRTCITCGKKEVKRAYYALCTPCATSAGACAMCTEKEPIVLPPALSADQLDTQKSQQENELKMLSERERRTFLRKNLSELTQKRREKNENGDDDREVDEEDEEEEESSDDDNLDLQLKESKPTDEHLSHTLLDKLKMDKTSVVE